MLSQWRKIKRHQDCVTSIHKVVQVYIINSSPVIDKHRKAVRTRHHSILHVWNMYKVTEVRVPFI